MAAAAFEVDAEGSKFRCALADGSFGPWTANEEWQVAAHAVGEPSSANFVKVAIPTTGLEPTDAAPLVLTLVHVSVDPYMRGRLSGVDSYAPAWKLHAAPNGGCVARVVASRSENFAVGDLVYGVLPWKKLFVSPTFGLTVIPKGLPPNLPSSAFLGVLGLTGLTALMPIQRFGQVVAGNVAFVSGAAGAVGLVTCALFKHLGCKVIASAGSDAKVALLREHGVDVAFNYKTADTAQQLRDAAPGGIDIFYDNVGGETLDAALAAMATGGRVILCGAISQYNLPPAERYGVKNIILAVGKSLSIHGFIVTRWVADFPAATAELLSLLIAGKIPNIETVREGFDAIPDAFCELFTGANTGKMIITL